MTTLAIPWIAFTVGVAWMVFMGFRAKREYRLRRTEEQRIESQRRLEDERQRPLFAGMR